MTDDYGDDDGCVLPVITARDQERATNFSLQRNREGSSKAQLSQYTYLRHTTGDINCGIVSA